ncbi:hypothetical protein NKJ70_30575 [Mesorhizobium sp. M0092]|uniref:hypothetical protein n=1 Tax=Mesorhizobium sp. M0092 TaxID=2956876 RepID=UPI00333DE14B
MPRVKHARPVDWPRHFVGFLTVKMNPEHTRLFKKAAGHGSKIDRIAGAMLARFGALMTTQIRPSRNEILDTLANWSPPGER